MDCSAFNARMAVAAALISLFCGGGRWSAAAETESRAIRLLALAAANYGATAVNARSLMTIAAVESPAGPYTVEVRTDLEDNIYFLQRKPDSQRLVAMQDGTIATADASGKTAPATPETAAFVAGHAFHWNLLKAQKVFHDLQVDKPARFADQRAIPLRMRSREGWPVTLYLRAKDKLALGMSIVPAGRDHPIDLYYQDWIDVGGARVFSRLTIVDGADIYLYRFVSIGFDDLSQGDFDLTAN